MLRRTVDQRVGAIEPGQRLQWRTENAGANLSPGSATNTSREGPNAGFDPSTEDEPDG